MGARPQFIKVAAALPGILPLHPCTRQTIVRAGFELRRVRVVDLVGYLDMLLQLQQRRAAAIATDSGGVQKETYFHGVPCVTLRGETEWTEFIEFGSTRLAPAGRADVAGEVLAAIGRTGRRAEPYGDDFASAWIAERLGGASLAEPNRSTPDATRPA